MGAYHTLDLELNQKFSLNKKSWDLLHLERLDLACDPSQKADVAAVILQEGLAHVCLVTANMTLLRAKIDMSIPRKRPGNQEQRSKSLSKFFDAIISALLRHVNFDLVKCVLVASPGFIRDELLSYMFDSTSANPAAKTLLENRQKFLSVHSSSGFKHSLAEVLSNSSVSARLADTKAAGDVRALGDFDNILGTEQDRAWYGIRQVERANQQSAIEVLLVVDSLFRSKDLAERKRYVKLVESVRESGGHVRLFSSLHATGERLAMLGGVAAILRFPIPDLDDDEEEVNGRGE